MDPQVALDDSTFVIRQGKHVHVEAPFLYLLLGTEAALLHDTGPRRGRAISDPANRRGVARGNAS